MTTNQDVLLIGGPRDNSVVTASGSGLIELEIDGLIHRYIITTKRRDHDGTELPVYNYDGEVAPGGGLSGAEDGRNRLASPLASGDDRTVPADTT